MTRALDQHRSAVGIKRKEAFKHLTWAHEALEKCRSERDELLVLRTLINNTRELVRK